MTKEKQKIELRSDDVEDILGKVPGWLTRNGILMLFLIVVLLLFGSWVFKIPDVKKARISVTSLMPPADIEARSDGKIEKLFVDDNEIVRSGQVLAVIENSAEYFDVLDLKNKLSNLQIDKNTFSINSLKGKEKEKLGIIQSDYANFYKNFRDYQEFLELNYHQRKIELLNKENEQYELYSINLDSRASILKEEYLLSEKQFLRDSTLFLQGVVAESNYENTKSQMLTKRANWQSVLSLRTENDIKIAGIREQILEMELKQQEQSTLLYTSLEESLNKLESTIALWEQLYLIIAPLDGQVTFNRIWSENQNVKLNEKVMTIIPGEASALIGKINLPLMGSGKVRQGQIVNIKFDNFPYLEYGMVKGKVENVSKVPQNDHYTVQISFPDGLLSYYGVEIEFSQNMQGQAEIITEKMRLLQKIFNPVRSSLSKQREL